MRLLDGLGDGVGGKQLKQHSLLGPYPREPQGGEDSLLSTSSSFRSALSPFKLRAVQIQLDVAFKSEAI